MSTDNNSKVTHHGIHVQETPNSLHAIEGTPTSITAFVGLTEKGPKNKAVFIHSFLEFQTIFGKLQKHHALGFAVRLFFLNGGNDAVIISVGTKSRAITNSVIGKEDKKTGIYALDTVSDFNLMCIPPYNKTNSTSLSVYLEALEYCKKRRAFLIVDPPALWRDASDAQNNFAKLFNDEGAAIYFPRVQIAENDNFAPCGIVAGIIARTDKIKGIWKAPAGTDASISGISDFTFMLSDIDIGLLNSLGINCLRKIPGMGFVVWGSRTMKGGDMMQSQWKYIPVKRTALYVESSVRKGLSWITHEPNDAPLWVSVRAAVSTFMHKLFRQGVFQGNSPKQAYFVKCDETTTTRNDIESGILNVVVGFAPLKPAEFVIVEIQLCAAH